MAAPRAQRPQFTTIINSQWSNHDLTCASIGNDYRVHFLNTSGADQLNLRISRNQRALTIAWSTATNALAIGWSDGTVSIWSNGSIVDNQPLEKSPIDILAWHPLSSTLISCSRNGMIAIWSITNNSSEISLISSIQSQIQVQYICFSPIEKHTAFIVSKEANIYAYQEGMSTVEEVVAIPKPVKYVSINSDGTSFISASGENILSIFHIDDLSFVRKAQKKLDNSELILFTSISDEYLCYSINDTIHLASSENGEEITQIQASEGDSIIAIQFYTATNELAAMTTAGRVVVWRMDYEKQTFSISRRLESSVEAKKAFWSPFSKNAITIPTDDSYSVCTVPIIRCLSTKEVVVLQTDTKSLSLNGNHRKRFQFNIERLAASGSHLLVASDSGARVFAMGFGSLSSVAEFEIPTSITEILGENIYVANGQELEVRNLQGEIKQTLEIESNSAISHMALNGKYLCLATQNSHPLQIFLYDVSRRVPRLVGSSQFAIKNKIYRVRSIAVSRGGFCVSISLDFFVHGRWEISPKLYLQSPVKPKTVALPIPNGAPLNHLWDSISGRLVCVQTTTAVYPFFVNTNLETSELRHISMGPERLIFKVETPRILHVLDGSKGPPLSVDGSVSASLMCQFSTLDGVEPTTRRLLTEIFFAIKTEQRESAVKIVQGIEDEFIARTALRFCLAIQERELADICMSKLKQEKTVSTEQNDDKLAFINHLSSSSYEEAATVCAPTDKLNLRANTYLAGLMAEFDGNLDQAIEYFDTAECQAPEVLRIAMHQGNLKQIFMSSIGGNSDPQLHRWIGRFYEYHQVYDTAISHYDICGDLRESIRLLCLLGRYDEANRRVSDTDQRSAICLYARLLMKHITTLTNETQVKAMKKQIVELFQKAGQMGAAFEFAFSNTMHDELIQLSLSAPRPLVAKAAQHFEKEKDIKTAALLFNRAGRMNKALHLCLEFNQIDALDIIADNVKDGTDPDILERCAEVFMNKQQFKRAAHFFALARRFDKTYEICENYKVKLPVEFIESLSNLKGNNDPTIRRQIAKLCEQQEVYITAAQIYIKLNDHLSAMKNIIAAGDTEKVVKFAQLLNRKDAYIFAADYISGTMPREGQPLFATCIQFYQKGDAYDKIAEFMDKVAMNEIEQYHNYQKAEEYLKMAHQTITKTEMTKERDTMVELYLQKIRWIEMYIEATKCVQSDPLRMQSLCNELLQTRGVDQCLRIEDVYMLLVKHFVTQENFSQAHRILENMKMNGVDLKEFMDEETIIRIYRAAGQTYVLQEEEVQEEEQVDDIPDDIAEEISDDF